MKSVCFNNFKYILSMYSHSYLHLLLFFQTHTSTCILYLHSQPQWRTDRPAATHATVTPTTMASSASTATHRANSPRIRATNCTATECAWTRPPRPVPSTTRASARPCTRAPSARRSGPSTVPSAAR